VTVSEFDAVGNLRRIVNPRGVGGGDTPSASDTAPRRTSIDSEGDRGNVALREATRHATVHEYSPDNVLTAIHMPHDGSDEDPRYRQTFALDARGRTTAIDAPHEWARNPAVCSTETPDPTGERAACIQRTEFDRLDTGWISEARGPQGRIGEQRFGGEIQQYAYDRRGLQTEWRTLGRDRSARRQSTRAYWPSGRLRMRMAEKLGADAASEPRRVYDYGYSSNGRLTSMIDRGAASEPGQTGDDRPYRMAYDAVDRLVATDEDDQAGSPGRAGRDTLIRYDRHGNPLERRTDGSLVSRVAGGVLDGDAYTGGTRTTFGFDAFDRETETLVQREGEAEQRFATSYWPSDDRRRRDEFQAGAQRVREDWLYANDGRVIGDQRRTTATGFTDAATPSKNQSYAYDANGNRERDERGSYTFNARDQLRTWDRPSTHPSPGGRFAYDINGAGDVLSREQAGGQRTSYFAAREPPLGRPRREAVSPA